jgi:uncharacterized protein
MDKESVIAIAKEYAQLVIQHIKPVEIILYGSYAKGTATKESDIDIAVIVPVLVDDFLDMATMLFHIRVDLDDRIEPKLIVESHDYSGFLEDVRKTGYRIYPEA